MGCSTARMRLEQEGFQSPPTADRDERTENLDA